MTTKQPTRFTIDNITVLCGDCTVLLRTIEPGYTIITDPPYTMMSFLDVVAMLDTLPYKPADVLVLTNPLSGFMYRGEFHIVPALSTTATEYHRHQRPLEAITKVMSLTTGPVIDPYCGSGTTLLAAHLLGRASVGIELDRHTFERCAERIQNAMGYGGQIF